MNSQIVASLMLLSAAIVGCSSKQPTQSSEPVRADDMTKAQYYSNNSQFDMYQVTIRWGQLQGGQSPFNMPGGGSLRLISADQSAVGVKSVFSWEPPDDEVMISQWDRTQVWWNSSTLTDVDGLTLLVAVDKREDLSNVQVYYFNCFLQLQMNLAQFGNCDTTLYPDGVFGWGMEWHSHRIIPEQRDPVSTEIAID